MRQPQAKIGFQCVVCGWYTETGPKPDKCPKCGHREFHEVNFTYGVDHATMDRVSEESVAHLIKKVEKCFNYETNPITKEKYYHPLKLKQEIDTSGAKAAIPPEKRFVMIRERCEECGQLYTQRMIPGTRPDVLAKLGIKIPD